MTQSLKMILIISVFLLGGYILIIGLWNFARQADYHVGCYSTNQTYDQSIRLRAKFQQLRQRGEYNRHFSNKVKNAELVDPHMHQKSVELTKNVEKYIETLVLAKGYQQSNMEFFMQLDQARRNYEACTYDLEHNFNPDQCISLWSNYQQCASKIDEQKGKLRVLFDQRNSVSRQIDQMLVFDPSKNKSNALQEHLRKIKQKYDNDHSLNDQDKNDLLRSLKQVQHRQQTKVVEFEQQQLILNRTKYDYEICMKNLKQFKKCEDIANTLKQYGYAESAQSLERRIKSKRQNLIKMRELVIESQNNQGTNEQNTQIKDMYEKRESEYKQILRLRLYMGYDQMKECGCKQSDKIKLQLEYENSVTRKNTLTDELNHLNQKINSLEYEIRASDIKRQQLLNDYRQQTERLLNQNISFPDLSDKLKLSKRNLQEINTKINGFPTNFNSEEFLCNQYKDRLAQRLTLSNELVNCLGRKDLYEKLRSKSSAILHIEEGGNSAIYKDNIKNILSLFVFPKAIDYTYHQPENRLTEQTQQTQQIEQIKQTQPQDVTLKIHTVITETQHIIQNSTSIIIQKITTQEVIIQVVENEAIDQVESNQQIDEQNHNEQQGNEQADNEEILQNDEYEELNDEQNEQNNEQNNEGEDNTIEQL